MSGNIDITPTEEEIADLKITPASSEPAEKSEEKIEEEKWLFPRLISKKGLTFSLVSKQKKHVQAHKF